MGLHQWPTQNQYLEAERESSAPAATPTNEPLAPIKIRWLTPSNYPGGRVWNMEEVTLEPDERIFDQKIFEEDKIYWSQDTRTHLTSQATCASVSTVHIFVNCLLWLTSICQFGIQNGNRIFVTTRGHSDTLDEDAVNVKALLRQHQYIHANGGGVRVPTTSQ